MLRKYHILSIILLIGFTLCLSNGFADADAFPWERVTFPTPQGDGYIQGTPEFQRVPEVIIGDPDFEKLRDLPPDSQDYGLSRKVGLIFVPARDDPDQGSICTGFLVGPDLFMTNHHCIRDASGLLPLAGAEIYMDYYQDPDVDETLGGVTARVSTILRADAWKDYALLRLDTPIGNTYGWLTLDATTPVNLSQSVKLISHPRGRSKEIVRKNSQITAIPEEHSLSVYPFVFAYFADSESGSSGSPVFLRDGTGVIGIHHSGWYEYAEPLFNAGSLMSYIVYEIQEWLPSGTALPPPPKPSTKLLYWAEWDEERIQRANLNGTGIQHLVTSIETQDIAFDVAAGKMYWADWNADKIQRSNLNGTDIEDLITGVGYPRSLALDVAAGKMYWATGTAGKIRRANLNGTDIEDLVAGLLDPHGLALDVAAGKMYWADWNADKIQRSNLNGTDIEDLVTAGLQLPIDIALDVASGKMYWAEWKGWKIRRANLNGTNVEDLVTEVLALRRLVLDVAERKIYWINGSKDEIQRSNLNGTNVENLATGADRPIALALYVPEQQTPRPPTQPPTQPPTRPPTQPPTLSLSAVGDQTFTVGTPVSLSLPAAIGGTAPYTYTLSPIPAGLQFDTATRALSGTPTTPGTTTATYAATDASEDRVSLTFKITVTDPPPAPISFDPSTIANQTFPANTAITPLTLPLATGGTSPYTYTLSPIPAGLAFESAKRELTGTPTTPGTTSLTYTATDASEGTASLTFKITVTDPPPAPISFDPSTVSDQTFIVNTPITPLVLPQATGGRPPYTYRISPTPIGFRFESGKRALTGTPTIVGTVTVTYIATDVRRETASLRFTITVIAAAAPELPVDVNGDGEVSAFDLVIVALFYGTQVPMGINLPADVNTDGSVDILDLTAVAQAIDTTGENQISVEAVEQAVLIAAEQAAELEDTAAGAPMRSGDSPRAAASLSIRLAAKNLAAALVTIRTDARFQKGVARLEGLLTLLTEMSAIPETTALLPNYPNPFNPETWLPYQLSASAEVVLSIYSVEGRLVRRLDLGHQSSGVYHSKHRAAYWDGKNQSGEKVASGLYFYTLTAGDFTATRKLLIAK